MKLQLIGSLVVSGFCLWVATDVRAAVLFQENFESHTNNGDVVGTNGWTQAFGGSSPKTTTATLLDGLAFDGSTVSGAQVIVYRSVPGPSVGAISYHLTADVVVSATRNTLFGFGTTGDTDQVSINYHDPDGWYVGVRGVAGGSPGGSASLGALGVNTDAVVQVSVDFDLVNETLTASVAGPDGTFTSPSISFDPSQLPSTTGIIIGPDTRFTWPDGIDVDNIVISDAIPEPTAMALFALSAAVFLPRQRSTKR